MAHPLIQATNEGRTPFARELTLRLQRVSAHRVIALEGRFTALSETKLARHRHREPLCLGSTSL